MGVRIELLNEICLTIEIPIRFATDENPALVVLRDVGAPIEIGVDLDFGELPPRVEATPDVGTAIAVLIPGSNIASGGPHLDSCDRDAGHGAQQSDEIGREMSHEWRFKIPTLLDGNARPRSSHEGKIFPSGRPVTNVFRVSSVELVYGKGASVARRSCQ